MVFVIDKNAQALIVVSKSCGSVMESNKDQQGKGVPQHHTFSCQ
jgi:hypothetical protein